MYRERQKTFGNINKPAPKTSAERAKAYRERQKIKKSEIATAKDDFDKPAPKTSTERVIAFTERKTIKNSMTTTTTSTVSNLNLLRPDHGAEHNLYTVHVHNECQEIERSGIGCSTLLMYVYKHTIKNCWVK